jgi:PPP family 3-phenylpropionic acid transporter
MIAFGAEFLLVLVLAQLLHAASFALFHILLVQWLHQAFDGHLAQGQALYSSLTYGVGGVLGSLLAGYAWVWGAGGATFGLAAMASFVALCLVMLYRHQEVADK